MLALTCSAVVAFAFGLTPQGQRERFRQPPTPDEAKQQITERLLASQKRSLATLRETIKKIEEEPDPRVREAKATLLKRLKEIEADDVRRIEQLERGQLNPGAPAMPPAKPGDTRPKPPIRD